MDVLPGILEKDERLLDDLIQTIRRRIGGRETGKVRKFIDHVLELAHLVDDRPGAFIEDRSILLELVQVAFPETLGRELNGGQGILDLVGDPSSHFPPCRHPLGLDQLGQIIKDGNDTDRSPFLVFQVVQVDEKGLGFPVEVDRHLFLDGLLLGGFEFRQEFLDLDHILLGQYLREGLVQNGFSLEPPASVRRRY